MHAQMFLVQKVNVSSNYIYAISRFLIPRPHLYDQRIAL